MTITAFDLAQRFVGVRELPGNQDNAFIHSFLALDGGDMHDEIAWCSAFVNYCAWLLRLPRSKSLAARSWLAVGTPVDLDQAAVGFDVVVLKRGSGSPGPDVLNAPGHVGFFAGLQKVGGYPYVAVLGGNQSDSVKVSLFPAADILGVRRLA